MILKKQHEGQHLLRDIMNSRTISGNTRPRHTDRCDGQGEALTPGHEIGPGVMIALPPTPPKKSRKGRQRRRNMRRRKKSRRKKKKKRGGRERGE